ncbi:MAG TPA: FAD-dependent oxidoreductase [Fimbriimonas sp.]
MSSDLRVLIDGREARVPAGTTVLEAAKSIGIEIPTLCWLPKEKPWASCLVCAVQVEGSRRTVPSCATVVQEGMSVSTDSPAVLRQRKVALELLLSDHVGDCIAPCETVCPAHLDIPAMNLAIFEDRLDAAAAIVKDAIPLPATLGRICPAPCEGRCRRKGQDGSVSVCLLKRYVGDERPEYAPAVAPPNGKRVAVVGAGPAGLSVAYFLRRRGYAVVVFDGKEQAGGALRDSIPPERLPQEVLDAEIAAIAGMGVEFQLGREVRLEEARRNADAVVLATGPAQQREAMVGIDFGDRGIKAKKGTGETNLPGVFATGASVAPGKISIRSIGDGHAVADSVHEYLSGEKVRRPAWTLEVDRNSTDFPASRRVFASEEARHEPSGGGFSRAEAIAEAARCLRCGCAKADVCVLRDLSGKYGAEPARYKGAGPELRNDVSHGEVVFESGKCIRCGICVRIAARHHEALGLAFVGRGFGTAVGGPFGEPLANALKVAARECALACPTGALYLKAGAGEGSAE